MPTLNWIGKEKVINHHRDVPFKILEHKYGFNETDGEVTNAVNSGNKIIHGDNLEALKSLLPEYEGKIKCIYIDPPYNTGNENWVYNDNVNHPKIKKWLEATLKAKESGKEAAIGIDDLARHDKWLCMMYPRLKLLQKLLADDGVIFISIDDNEQVYLKMICDEIFGPSNFIANIIWRGGKRNAAKYISNSHEYVLFYTKNLRKIDEKGIHWKTRKSGIDDIYKKVKELRNKHKQNFEEISKLLKEWFRNLPESNPAKDHKHYNSVDEKGIYCSDNVSRVGGGMYSIKNPITGNIIKPPTRGWVWGKEEDFWKAYENGLLIFSESDNLPVLKRYLHDNEYQLLDTVFYKDRRASAKLLSDILGREVFQFPKDLEVISYLINAVSDSNTIILDSFAGSGTTAHAVLNLNKQDGGNRKFILVEMEDYANTITAERVKRVIKVYGDKEGTGGSFDYYELGKPLFVGENNEYLNEEVDTQKIREYIWYSETRKAFEQPDTKSDTPYFLGKKEGTAYYFIYEKESLTTLDYDTLSTIKTKAGQYVIYADNCLLPKDFMMKKNIVFKKIPRDVTRF